MSGCNETLKLFLTTREYLHSKNITCIVRTITYFTNGRSGIFGIFLYARVRTYSFPYPRSDKVWNLLQHDTYRWCYALLNISQNRRTSGSCLRRDAVLNPFRFLWLLGRMQGETAVHHWTFSDANWLACHVKTCSSNDFGALPAKAQSNSIYTSPKGLCSIKGMYWEI